MKSYLPLNFGTNLACLPKHLSSQSELYKFLVSTLDSKPGRLGSEPVPYPSAMAADNILLESEYFWTNNKWYLSYFSFKPISKMTTPSLNSSSEFAVDNLWQATLHVCFCCRTFIWAICLRHLWLLFLEKVTNSCTQWKLHQLRDFIKMSVFHWWR